MSSVLSAAAGLPRLSKVLLVIGGLSLMAATQLSAFGFHGLPKMATPQQVESWHWATELQFHQSLGLVLLALLAPRLGNPKLLTAAAAIMILGLVLFCGTIYVNTLGIAPVGQFAPFGGGSFMLAWLLVAIAAFRAPRTAG